MKNSTLAILIILLLGVMSCKDRGVSTDKYISYVTDEEHLLIKKQTIGALEYKVSFKPSDYILLNRKLNKKEFVKSQKELANYIEFDLRIQSEATGNVSLFKSLANGVNEYSKLNDYFQNATADFTLLIDDEEYLPTTYFFTPNQGFTPYEQMLVGFNLPESKKYEKIQFVYKDKVFKHGHIYFTFFEKDINKIPKLKLS